MPCMCWYEPDNETKKKFKFLCQEISDLIKETNRIGDPLGISSVEAKKLIDHIYSGECPEKPRG